jgi:hypothetical protein
MAINQIYGPNYWAGVEIPASGKYQAKTGATTTAVAKVVTIVDQDGESTGAQSSIYADQQVVTASAANLTARALKNGLTIKAKNTNAGAVFVGGPTVTATNDGTGNGFSLLPGEALSISVSNANAVHIIGTLNDVVYVMGN